LRKRIRRMGASTSTRSEMTHAVITMLDVDSIAASTTPLLLVSGRESETAFFQRARDPWADERQRLAVKKEIPV
jgi:hypothetical protein